MISKKERLIIAFHSTHDAISFESACVTAGLEGRLIPLPKEISAGCGLAWSAPPETEQTMKQMLLRERIEAEQIRICMI